MSGSDFAIPRSMPRKIIDHRPDLPYHINARCLNREWFSLAMPTVWSIMEDYLYLIHAQFGIRIHAFVLMSNHFHLLATAPENNMPQAMRYFMCETSRTVTRLAGRINQTYGARYHKTLLGNPHYFLNSYKYVYQNPLRARLVQRVEDYPYSTLSGLCGLRRLIIPVDDSVLFAPKFDQATLEWLNRAPHPAQLLEMRAALRKVSFHLAAARSSGKPSLLENNLLYGAGFQCANWCTASAKGPPGYL